MRNIVIGTTKSWNFSAAVDLMFDLKPKYKVHVFQDEHLFNAITPGLNPLWVFLPHWNWIVPKEIWEIFRCVAFHIADLPNGRGGSPVQNLIVRKIYDTQLTAFRINEIIDGGDVYMKRPLSLKDGTVEDILRRASDIIFKEMIPCIIETDIALIPQKGETILSFSRRTPCQSDLNMAGDTIEDIYDYIRMLDGEGYPRAFLNFGEKGSPRKILLSGAKLSDGKLTGAFEIE